MGQRRPGGASDALTAGNHYNYGGGAYGVLETRACALRAPLGIPSRCVLVWQVGDTLVDRLTRGLLPRTADTAVAPAPARVRARVLPVCQ